MAITARPFGAAACVKKLAGHVPEVPAPPAVDAVVAVLTVTQAWAEFSVGRGDQLLFARQDSVESAWGVVDPVIAERSLDLPLFPYERGTWGPVEADHLMPEGWHQPKVEGGPSLSRALGAPVGELTRTPT